MASVKILLVCSSLVLHLTSSSDQEEVRDSGRHCSSPGGVMDGKILVEDDTGVMTDLTTVTWQIGLGETLCYR